MRRARDGDDLVLDALERRLRYAEELLAQFGPGGVGVAPALRTAGEVVFV